MRNCGIILVIVALGSFSCKHGTQVLDRPADESNVNRSVLPTVQVGDYSFELANENGQCILYDRRVDAGSTAPVKSVLEMLAPCEFIRQPGNLSEVLIYEYGKQDKRLVLMIVGGPPDEMRKDMFLDKGCGTEIQALTIFRSSIEITPRIEQGAYSIICPSDGLDEVFFATIPIKSA